MKKEKQYAFEKEIYLLGEDADGIKYWLEEASWDCDWYFGFGYIETYTNNDNPSEARDISSHNHYDSKILKNGVCPDDFKKIFIETPLTDGEIWRLNELMETFYILKKYHALIHRGSTNITNNPIKEILKNKNEFLRLKNDVFPKLFEEIYKILTPKGAK